MDLSTRTHRSVRAIRGLALAAALAAAPASVLATDSAIPSPATLAGWLQQHLALEYRSEATPAVGPDAATLAGWLQQHLLREETD